MKKLLPIALAAMMMPAIGHAQFGLLERAAKKAVQKTTEKVVDRAVDRASDAAADAIEKKVESSLPKQEAQSEATASTPATYEGLMLACPELPSVDAMVSHKDAELNEKAFKLLTSKVTSFSTKVLELSAQCATLGYESLDSATVVKMAQSYTGLTDAEMQALSKMSNEEQQAWLEQHYSQERAQAAQMKTVADASQWLEPLQPMIDRWEKAGAKADEAYKVMDNKLRPIYAKYADRMKTATGKDLVNLQVAYYTECAPHLRTAVQAAMNTRLKEQLPIAEQLEKEMAKIRATHPDAVAQLLNYPKLTATQFFTEAVRLMEIPTYDN